MANQGVATVGSELYLSAIAAAEPADQAAFELLTFTLLDEVVEIGSFGPTRSVLTYKPVNTGFVNKLGGPRDFGSLTVKGADVPDNAGQIIAQQAEETNTKAAAKLVLTTGQTVYFNVSVTSFVNEPGNADAVAMVSINMDLASEIVRVTA